MLRLFSRLLGREPRILQWSKLSAKEGRAHFRSRGGEIRSPAMAEETGWLECGPYKLFVWSVSGLETTVVVKSTDLLLAFDMGYACRPAVKCKHVFISHGHQDHCVGVPHHFMKRSLFGMTPATYYMLPHLCNTMDATIRSVLEMSENLEVADRIKIVPHDTTDTMQLSGNYTIQSFPTQHRVKSQGYLLYRQSRKLKPEFVGLPSHQVAALHREGQEIHQVSSVPELAYMGDTTFEVFQSPPTPDILRAKVVITEATYVDDEGSDAAKAQERGHTHLSEIVQNAHLFANVESLVLMHFSDKYSVEYLRKTVAEKLPAELQQKVQIATIAKEVL